MALHVLCIGAHPDDSESSIGGTAAMLRRRGDVVRFVSVTNGNKGHFAPEYRSNPDLLIARRDAEARSAASIIGAEYECLGIPDGEVYVTPEATQRIVRLIRSFGEPGRGPDLVLLNRPNDYHRDHRYTAQLVLDASYMLTVPMMCPDTRHLGRMPVFAYWWDRFTEPTPFRVDVAVPIDDTLEQKIDMICRHESQFFEWLPYNAGMFKEVPRDPAGRRVMIADKYRSKASTIREACAACLPSGSWYAEAFQVSEYGRQPPMDELRQFFPV